MNTVTETRDVKPFSSMEMRNRMLTLREQYGEDGLAEISGIGKMQIRKYCSERYMQKHAIRQITWEKYFGPWEDDIPTFRMTITQETIKAAAAEQKNDISEAESETTEAPEDTAPDTEVKMPRLILEVPSLEELDCTLELYGMKMVIE